VGRKGLAARLQRYLTREGLIQTQIGDVRERPRRTTLFYPKGWKAVALEVRAKLPFEVEFRQVNSGAAMLLVLAPDTLEFDRRLRLRIGQEA
jgi:hypothetical protein